MIDPLEGRKAYKIIYRRRMKLKLGQPDLAIATGISQATLSKFERGQIAISFDKYFLLLRALGIKVTFSNEKIEK